MPGIDINYFIRQASKMTEKIEQRKKELANETFEGQAGNNLVVATANGVPEITRIKIAPGAVDANDPSMLEDLVVAAVNAALTLARERSQKELEKISGGMKIPGIT